MINVLFETCDFTNNPNFILFKWTLKRKHLPTKCVICATEIHRMEIRLNKNEKRTLKVKFFSHEKSNSHGILAAYLGKETFTIKKQQTGKES